MSSLPSSKRAGFSLIELLVTVSIIAIITAIIVVRYGSFNNSVILKSQAFELALDIREAQVFSVSVRGNANQFRRPYGIHIADGATTYDLFSDNSFNVANRHAFPLYQSVLKVGESYVLDSKVRVTAIYAADTCVGQSSSRKINDVSISFIRPDFDAYLSSSNGGSRNKLTHPINGSQAVCIELRGSDGTSAEQRGVIVTNTGQITVE